MEDILGLLTLVVSEFGPPSGMIDRIPTGQLSKAAQ